MFTMFETSLRKLTELHDNLKERYEERNNNNGTLTRSSSVQSRISTASRKTEELGLFGNLFFFQKSFNFFRLRFWYVHKAEGINEIYKHEEIRFGDRLPINEGR